MIFDFAVLLKNDSFLPFDVDRDLVGMFEAKL
jgi:hypothetical protein